MLVTLPKWMYAYFGPPHSKEDVMASFYTS
jgi:hypothetical protein